MIEYLLITLSLMVMAFLVGIELNKQKEIGLEKEIFQLRLKYEYEMETNETLTRVLSEVSGGELKILTSPRCKYIYQLKEDEKEELIDEILGIKE